jgi:type IX secretion system PorP/SprF family membrane protein
MFRRTGINPAAAGSHDRVDLTALPRNQWGNLGPNTSYFNANMPFNLFNQKHGVGLSIHNDNSDFYSELGLNLSYAFRKEVGSGILSAGINGGVYNNDFSPEWYMPDELGSTNDVSLPQKESATAFDMGIGVFYKTDELYCGISALHLNQGKLKYQFAEPSYVRHFILTGGYSISFKNPKFTFEPSFLVGSNAVTTDFVFSGILYYNKKVWGGLSSRIGSAIIGMLGFELFENVETGLAYDFETTPIRQYGGGSYEILIRYGFEINKDKIPVGYKSIRYL